MKAYAAFVALPGWLARLSIRAKLTLLVAAFLLAIAGVLATCLLALTIANGIRAYVGGEGLYSKGQKDAVHYLLRYAHSHDPEDYQTYRAALAIPLGDGRARRELLKPDFDRDAVTAGFIAGGNAPEDVPTMIFLFRNFQHIRYLESAIATWADADAAIAELDAIAAELHRTVRTGTLDREDTALLLLRVEQVNGRFTPLEEAFSRTLGEGARAIQGLMPWVVLLAAALLLAFALPLAYGLSRHLRTAIGALHQGAERVAVGELDARIDVQSPDELGALAAAFNIMIERRAEAEHALREAHDLRATVMQNATNAIYALDAEGRFTMVNQRLSDISGYGRDELVGQSFGLVFPAEHLPELARLYTQMMQQGTPVLDYEVSLVRKDGVRRSIVFSTAPLSKDGVIFGAAGAAEDITERQRAAEALRLRAEELARSNQELEQFAYVASHDLQEPLRTVTGFAQLLVRKHQGQLGQEGEEFIGYITAGVARMKSLIEDLLSFSRVRRSSPEPFPLVDTAVALKTALANLKAALDASGAVVELADLPRVPGDRAQLAQLFQNLVGNALKFRSGETPHIRVSASAEAGCWHFAVRDNGIGIAPEHAERVFALFQRLHNRESHEGNGIGLTICRKIVELHGGRIWVESPNPDGPGTSFHFTLEG